MKPTDHMTCEEAEPLLLLKLYGELESKHKELQQHLATCETCQKVEQNFLKVMELDQKLPPESPALPTLIIKKSSNLSTVKVLMTLAAALLLSLGLIWLQPKPTPPQTMTHHNTEKPISNTQATPELIDFDPFKPLSFKRKKKYSLASLNTPRISKLERRLKSISHIQPL